MTRRGGRKSVRNLTSRFFMVSKQQQAYWTIIQFLLLCRISLTHMTTWLDPQSRRFLISSDKVWQAVQEQKLDYFDYALPGSGLWKSVERELNMSVIWLLRFRLTYGLMLMLGHHQRHFCQEIEMTDRMTFTIKNLCSSIEEIGWTNTGFRELNCSGRLIRYWSTGIGPSLVMSPFKV